MGKKILYMSCHEILEYDEIKMFTELGHEVYSLGAYTQPGGDENRKRPALDLPYNPHFIELALQYPKENLHPEMLEGIDIVIVMHTTTWITENWPLFKKFIDKGGRVIWRSIGQSIPAREHELKVARSQGLEIVRYSPAESTIKDWNGSDATIRFYKDPEEFKDWNGGDRRIINFTQSMKQRGDFCGWSIYQKATRMLPRVVYGPNNDDLGEKLNGGMLSADEQLKAYQNGRVYFYHGTYPASYTLTFMEAFMTGIPVVSVGHNEGNSFSKFPDQKTFEVPEMIDNQLNGFVSDNPAELREYLEYMLSDHRKAKAIGAFGRRRAIELFGKAKIKREWEQYLA